MELAHATWKECVNGGREVVLHTHASYAAPTPFLIVYQDDAPCSN